eukprot:m.81160 g.81160  ORF g.81160 m.81160 type:complete len:54 (-) comp8218_c1_seq4:364-525(-)
MCTNTHCPAAMPVILYMTSVSSSLEIKKRQQKIELTLQGLGIDFQSIDICKMQ